MDMKKGLAYMLVGMGLAAGAMAVYHRFNNGNLKNTLNNARIKLKIS